jgi:Pyruvate/2-oxoacid:ferredoxin oxidoreductase delta subunit
LEYPEAAHFGDLPPHRRGSDNAVIKLGPGKRFQFNYEYCEGCGLCAAECPCGAINMAPEAI